MAEQETAAQVAAPGWRGRTQWLGANTRRYPLTLALLLLTIALPAILRFGFHLGPRSLLALLGVAPDAVARQGRLYSLGAALFVSENVTAIVVSALLIVVLVGFSERLIGSWRALLGYLITGTVGIGIGILTQWLLYTSGERWGRTAFGASAFEALVPVFGTVMVASAAAGPFWRRRIRVIGLAVTITFMLFSGQPSDLHRLIAVVVGIVIGPLLTGRTRIPRFVRSSVQEVRALLAAVVTIVAIGPVITLTAPHKLGPLSPLGELFRPNYAPGLDAATCSPQSLVPSCIHQAALARLDGPGPLLLSLLPLTVLLISASGLLRGRRAALWIAIGVNVLLAGLAAFYYGFLPSAGNLLIIDLSEDGQWEMISALAVSTLIPLAIAVILFAMRSRFTVRVTARRVRIAAAWVSGVFVVSSVFLVGFGMLFPDSFTPTVTLSMLLNDLPERFIPVGFLGAELDEFLPVTSAAHLLYLWIGPLTWAVLAAVTLWLVRGPSRDEGGGSMARFRALRHAGMGGSLGHMGLWAGRRHWTSASGDAAIAFVVIGEIALTVSEPLCRAEDRGAAIREFAEDCERRGWTAVFYAVHEEFVQHFAAMGWSTVRVGEEAILDTADWTLSGKSKQDIRTSINRADRAGIEAVWTSWAELSLGQHNQIRSISEEWVAEHELPEMGFTLGGLTELADPETRLMLAISADGTIEAITSWMPNWCAASPPLSPPAHAEGVIDGWTLDVMRRRDGSINGVMEFLIAAMLARASAAGERFVSLSTAPFASALDESGGMAERIQRVVGRALEPVYGFGSLLRFKSKFRPRFAAVSVAFPDPTELPLIASAIVRAYLPGVRLRDGVTLVRSRRPVA